MEKAKLFEMSVPLCPGTSGKPAKPFFMDFTVDRKQTGKEADVG